MRHSSLPLIIILIGAVISFVHSFALVNFLYWQLPWLDVVMHLLGGLFISLSVLWIYSKYLERHTPDYGKLFLFDVILVAFIVGLIWETFELYFVLSIVDLDLYVKDTVMDFVMNTVGATIGYFYFSKLKISNE